MTRPCASLSVDLDNLWAYQRTSGAAGWERLGSYLHVAVPRMLEAFDAAGCRATVFIVGADAAREDARELLGPIPAMGHEVGNHSYGHACWLHRSDREVIREELAWAHEAIRTATGTAAVGFRGPGFTWSPALLGIVAEMGYRFDASTLPTFIGPLARRRLLGSTHFSTDELAIRADLFGHWSDGFRPNQPYRWRLPDGRCLLEIPVTTIPGLRLPFHQSYLLYLANLSERLALWYLRTGLAACRLAGVQPSLLFHPLDWLGGDEVPELGGFPGMGLSVSRKLALLQQTLRVLNESFVVETMGEQAERLLRSDGLEDQTIASASDTGNGADAWHAVSIRGASR